MSIDLPRTGAAAQIYYRQFSSPLVADLIRATISPGMHVADVGAHAGEYSLLAARLVGPSGSVESYEPQPELARLIMFNARLNRLSNISVNAISVGAKDGVTPFLVDNSTGGGWVSQGSNVLVDCLRLDTALKDRPCALLKIDAAGNEADVIEGAQQLLARDDPPVVIYKVYRPEIVRSRFGCGVERSIEMLQSIGFEQWLLTDPPRPITTTDVVSLALDQTDRQGFAVYAHNSKAAASLPPRLLERRVR
jgi:FkbM family methyltransferase